MSNLNIEYCCTCLKVCSETDKFLSLGFFSSQQITYRKKLKFCVPEMGPEIEVDSYMCKPCSIALEQAYSFRCMCIRTESMLNSFRSKGDDSKDVNGIKKDLVQMLLKQNNLELLPRLSRPHPVAGLEEHNNVEIIRELGSLLSESLSSTRLQVDQVMPEVKVKKRPASPLCAEPKKRCLTDKEIVAECCRTDPQLKKLSPNDLNCQVTVEKITVLELPVIIPSGSPSKIGHSGPKLKSQQKLFPCNKCGKVLKKKEYFYSHILKHSNIRAYRCKLCSCSYFSADALRIHKKRLHPGRGPSPAEIVPKAKPQHLSPSPLSKNNSKSGSSSKPIQEDSKKAPPKPVIEESKKAPEKPVIEEFKKAPEKPVVENYKTVPVPKLVAVSTLISDSKQIANSTSVSIPEPIVKSTLVPTPNTEYILVSTNKKNIPNQKSETLESQSSKLQDGLEVLTCLYCAFQTSSKVEFNQHVTIHTVRGKYPCPHCRKHFAAPWVLNRHVREMHPTPSQKPQMANKPVTKKQVLPIIVKSEAIDEEQPYDVVDPQGLVRIKDEPPETVLEMNGDNGAPLKKKRKKYFCPECNQEFSSRDHANTHTGEKPYSCNICAKTYSAYETMRKHRKKVHADNQFGVAEPDGRPKEIHSCEICKQTFDNSYEATSHTCQTSSGESVYRCQICKNAYLGRNALIDHMRMHLEEND